MPLTIGPRHPPGWPDRTERRPAGSAGRNPARPSRKQTRPAARNRRLFPEHIGRRPGSAGQEIRRLAVGAGSIESFPRVHSPPPSRGDRRQSSPHGRVFGTDSVVGLKSSAGGPMPHSERACSDRRERRRQGRGNRSDRQHEAIVLAAERTDASVREITLFDRSDTISEEGIAERNHKLNEQCTEDLAKIGHGTSSFTRQGTAVSLPAPYLFRRPRHAPRGRSSRFTHRPLVPGFFNTA